MDTAPSYGDGDSEIKIGRTISHKRKEYTLVTKYHDRYYVTCKSTLEQSFKNLKTYYVDILLMHGVDRIKTLEELLTDEGAVKAVEEFIAAGKVGHISISMYGSTRCIN
ncbi:MAG TPA: hypothetical protein DHM42_03190 [Clostridiales bacterium]|nr:hypothetical protein [Clostridiales bacterium]